MRMKKAILISGLVLNSFILLSQISRKEQLKMQFELVNSNMLDESKQTFRPEFQEDSIQMIIIEGEQLFLLKKRDRVLKSSIRYLSGDVYNAGGDYEGFYHFSKKGGNISGQVIHGSYSTSYDGNETSLIAKTSVLNSDDCDTKPNLFPAKTSSKLETQNLIQQTVANSLVCNPDMVISNVQIGFTPNAYANTGINGLNSDPDMLLLRANQIVEQMNDAMINGNIEIIFRLVHAYVLNENESMDPDLDGVAKDEDEDFMENPNDGVWDEIFDKRQQFQADISIIITNTPYGGRANRGFTTKKFFFYGLSPTSNRLFSGGAAHEMGHLLDLDHHRASYSSIERIFLDGKKAYGYIDTNDQSHRTIMVQAGEPGVTFLRYSDPNINFPDGDPAVDSYAQARIRAAGSTSLSTIYVDENKLPETKYVNGIFDNNSFSYFVARDRIVIEPNTSFELGSSFVMEIKSCLE